MLGGKNDVFTPRLSWRWKGAEARPKKVVFPSQALPVPGRVALEQRPVKKVTSSFIRRVVENAEKRRPGLIGYKDILGAVCKLYGVSRKELSSPSRRRDHSEARTVATALVKEQRHLTLVGLSQRLKRDVTSLSHCLRRLEQRLGYDRGLRERTRQTKSML